MPLVTKTCFLSTVYFLNDTLLSNVDIAAIISVVTYSGYVICDFVLEVGTHSKR